MRLPSNRGVFAVAAVLLALVAISCGGGDGNEAKTVYLRDEFGKLVQGKTQEEVLKAVGKPDRTQSAGDRVYWYYNKITKDPVKNKIDSRAQVLFQGGRVASVSY
jgi:hypothetical protein